jgi:hypothetical protein
MIYYKYGGLFMNERIHVEEASLNEAKNALQTAGDEYKEQLAKLTNLINEITNGDIKGDPADDLLEKFRAKEDDFKSLATAIDNAQEAMGVKGKDFNNMIIDLKEQSK